MKIAAWFSILTIALASTPSLAQKREPLTAESIAAAQAQCDGGNVIMCDALGTAFMSGTGVKRDLTPAGPLLKRACDGENYAGCLHYGMWLNDEDNPARDRPAARQAFQTACDKGGVARACTKAGVSGVSKDIMIEELAYLMRGCDGGDGGGCVMAGMIYASGKPVPKDMTKAIALLEKGCGLSEGYGCMQLSIAYENGEGVPKDPAKAGMYRKRACELGSPFGC